MAMSARMWVASGTTAEGTMNPVEESGGAPGTAVVEVHAVRRSVGVWVAYEQNPVPGRVPVEVVTGTSKKDAIEKALARLKTMPGGTCYERKSAPQVAPEEPSQLGDAWVPPSSGRGYENAPATKMLATHCACCNRPLVDAVSVEAGVGPDCRAKYGYGEAQGKPDWAKFVMLEIEGSLPGNAHDCANVLVHRIAMALTAHRQEVKAGGEGRQEAMATHEGRRVARREEMGLYACGVATLGYARLAEVLADRCGCVRVEEEDGRLVAKARFNEAFIARVKTIIGRRYDAVTKSWSVPVNQREALWVAIQEAWAVGTVVMGKRGFTVIR